MSKEEIKQSQLANSQNHRQKQALKQDQISNVKSQMHSQSSEKQLIQKSHAKKQKNQIKNQIDKETTQLVTKKINENEQFTTPIKLQKQQSHEQSQQDRPPSYQSQFKRWEIDSIHSGKFVFTSVENPTNQYAQSKQQQIIQNRNAKIDKKKSPKDKETIKDFIKEIQSRMAQSKSLKTIFSHFCKQNYISHIKSTLFEDRMKVLEQMTLNKWMVFCKQFNLTTLLHTNLPNVAISKSRLVQQNIKMVKETDASLVNYFKKATCNLSKMSFSSFVVALSFIFEKLVNPVTSEQFLDEFLDQILCCATQKTCFEKLANLKIVFNTPQINYEKIYLTGTNISSQNENKFSNSNIKTQSKRQNFELNQVLKQAKNEVNFQLKSKSRITKKPLNALSTIPNLTPKPVQKKQGKIKAKLSLFQYFDKTHDSILDSYFEAQKGYPYTQPQN